MHCPLCNNTMMLNQETYERYPEYICPACDFSAIWHDPDSLRKQEIPMGMLVS